MVNMPAPKGQLTANRPLADLTWMRVGGPADFFFLPKNKEDLLYFMNNLCDNIDVFPIGVGSNVIVRDGGVRAVVIRLGRAFNHIEISGNQIRVGAAVLDAHLAKQAAQAGLDLTFLRTIPGAIGGAVKMNAVIRFRLIVLPMKNKVGLAVLLMVSLIHTLASATEQCV